MKDSNTIRLKTIIFYFIKQKNIINTKIKGKISPNIVKRVFPLGNSSFPTSKLQFPNGKTARELWRTIEK